MQVKCEVFSRFGNSVDFSSGEPLGGVEASTVGADLCVRPSSPELSLFFCGRTRRSAPTQATSARQFHSSNAVTPISVGADLCVRPSSPELSLFCGRTRRSAPTQATSARQFHSSNAVTSICRDTRSCLAGGRPLYQRLQHQCFNGDGRPPTRHSRASLHRLLVSSREEFSNSSVENENSPRGREKILRKNQMKLRKNQMISPKYF